MNSYRLTSSKMIPKKYSDYEEIFVIDTKFEFENMCEEDHHWMTCICSDYFDNFGPQDKSIIFCNVFLAIIKLPTSIIMTRIPYYPKNEFVLMNTYNEGEMINIIKSARKKIAFKRNSKVWKYIKKTWENQMDPMVEKHSQFLHKTSRIKIIQRAWRNANANPNYMLCKKRLIREFTELQV